VKRASHEFPVLQVGATGTEVESDMPMDVQALWQLEGKLCLILVYCPYSYITTLSQLQRLYSNAKGLE
jgi:hypothetical protein